MERSAEIAKNLLQIKAIKLSPQNPFTWASGLKSPIYCDNRKSLSYPQVRANVIDGFVELSNQFDEIDYIAGVATAGIAHGALLAAAINKPFIYVRSKPKGHGLQNLIEGHLEPNSKVLVIEDLISTGMSSMKAVDALREVGAEVLGVLAIFSYGFEKAKKVFEDGKCPFYTISNYSILLAEATKQNYISEEERIILMKWQSDPENWFSKTNK